MAEETTNRSTSKVIDSLHSQIDELRSELELLKLSHNDHKKRNTLLSTKNDSLVDQLANYKHENDMINALLKRKERRIADLEEEFDLLNSESESLKLSVKNYKIRCENLQESLASSAAEFERLKIAYDAIVAAQSEYKRHYLEEVAQLTNELSSYKKLSAAMLSEFMSKIDSNDKDVDVLIESLTSKRKALDSIYVSRNKTVIEFLGQLARAAKLHGEESRSILRDNVEIINLLREKMPELQESISERSETSVDLDSLLGDTSSCLDSDFADLSINSATSDETLSSNAQRPKNAKKNRQRKVLSRSSPEAADGQYGDVLPRSRQSLKGQHGGRSASGEHSQGLRLSMGNQRASSSNHSNNVRSSSGGSNRNSSYGGYSSQFSEGSHSQNHNNYNNNSQNNHGNNFHNNSYNNNTFNNNTHNHNNQSLQRSASTSNGGNNANRRCLSQLPTLGNGGNGGRNSKKQGSSPLIGNSGPNLLLNNKNYKRRLFHGGSNNYNIYNNELSLGSSQKMSADVMSSD